MIKFDVRTRWSNNLQFRAEIPCAEDAPLAVKLGLAVRWACLNGVSLNGANLRQAHLAGADFTGADLRGTILPTGLPQRLRAERRGAPRGGRV